MGKEVEVQRLRLFPRVAGTLLVAGLAVACGNQEKSNHGLAPIEAGGPDEPVAMATVGPEPDTQTISRVGLPVVVSDPSQCQPQDTEGRGDLYVSAALGIKRRRLPEMDVPFDSPIPQNTKLSTECARNVEGRLWLRASDGYGSFWIPEDFTSEAQVVRATPVRVASPSQQVAPTAELAPQSREPVDPLNWRRDEVLFGPGAGFDKARRGQSLTVWVDPAIGVKAEEIIGPWNNLARWNLFTVGSSGNADISFVVSDSTWVKPRPDYTVNYTSCTVYTNPSDYNLGLELRHEIGHCLGLVDFLPKNYPTAGYVNPKRCDDSNKLYFGVMSYCTWMDLEVWFGYHDRRILEITGYAQ